MHLGVFMPSFRISILFRPVFLIVITFLSTMALAARGSSEPPPISPGITVTDHFMREITLEVPAEIIVSLSPGITETVFALGYGDRLIGRTSYCDYPPEAADIPSVGSLTEPDIETIVALSPDIVIASTHFPEEVLTRLLDAGQNVAVLTGQESFQGAYDGVIRPVSVLLGDPEAGEQLVASMELVVAEASEKASSMSRRPSVYYVVGFGEGGDWTAGGDTFIGEMIEMAGGNNIADDVVGWSFSIESLVDRDPDLILVPAWAVEIFPTTPIYSNLRAVGNGSVAAIDENSIVRQGPRLADGFAGLVDIIGSVR